MTPEELLKEIEDGWNHPALNSYNNKTRDQIVWLISELKASWKREERLKVSEAVLNAQYKPMFGDPKNIPNASYESQPGKVSEVRIREIVRDEIEKRFETRYKIYNPEPEQKPQERLVTKNNIRNVLSEWFFVTDFKLNQILKELGFKN